MASLHPRARIANIEFGWQESRHQQELPCLAFGCFMLIEMRWGLFAVMTQANQRLLSLDVQA